MISRWRVSKQITFSFGVAVGAIFAGGAVAMVAVRWVASLAASGAAAERIARDATFTLWVVGFCIVTVAAVVALAGFRLHGSVKAAVRGLRDEIGRVRDSVVEGRLDGRLDPARVLQDFHPAVEAVDDVIASYAAPIRTALGHGERSALGEVQLADAGALRGEFRRLIDLLNGGAERVGLLVSETDRLCAALTEGRLETRAEAGRMSGSHRRMLDAVNRAVGVLVGHLDGMPAPAMIVDRDLRIRYLNRAAEALVGKPLREVVGQPCRDHFRAGDCGTEACACFRAIRDGRQAASETVARPAAGTFEISYGGAPIRDASGRVAGALATIADQTAMRREMRRSSKVADFQREATRSITGSLQRLALGEVGAAVPLPPGDEETRDARDAYEAIAAAIAASGAAVARVVEDVGALAAEAVAGRLAARADEGRHQGGFRRLVSGVNRTLEALAAPVAEADRVLQDLARGDLRARVTGTYQGDHARIQASTNATAQALHDALSRVASAAAQVSSAAAQIAASSQAVASGASQQAASIQDTAASLESVSSVTRSAAENAGQANLLARKAREAATEGVAAVDRMQGVMGKIKASAEGTSQIIKDVSEIALQTNLLALNAAVEAARAGEAGRGFAVVAEEVRSLAMRAKEAAQKTEALILESVRQAGEGEATSRRMTTTLAEISSGIGKVTDIVADIAAAAGEQSSGIVRVEGAVAEMDKVTQQNAASAEQSSSAASELSGQAEDLAAMVGAFRLVGAGAAEANHR